MKTVRFTDLQTERLNLRQPTLEDVPAIVRHAGDPRVALKTCTMPHPYFKSHALEWLDQIQLEHRRGDVLNYAIERKDEPGVMIGAISLMIAPGRCRAEIGYWLGVRHWRRGIMTEAVRRLFRYGFEELGLLYIHARHMTGNAASGRVMEKAGMRLESIIAGGLTRFGVNYDQATYGLFADEWRAHHT